MTLFIAIIILALIFDYINGFHDAANSIATIVSTKVLSPLTAVIWASGFNFLAYAIFKLNVADTVSKTVQTEAITLNVIMCGLIAAIIWNLFTWWRGIPSSSSHTLIGGFAGAAIAHAGFGVVKMDKVGPVLYFILLAPVIGMFVSYVISVITLNVCKRSHPMKVDKLFRVLQLISSAAFSLGHGGNDAQKVMGIIGAAMIVNGSLGDIKKVLLIGLKLLVTHPLHLEHFPVDGALLKQWAVRLQSSLLLKDLLLKQLELPRFLALRCLESQSVRLTQLLAPLLVLVLPKEFLPFVGALQSI